MTTVITILIIVALILFWISGGRETIGDFVYSVYPKAYMQKGDVTEIYINGTYNRKATISKVATDGVYVYDNRIKLPLSYRGSFYGYGIDDTDGSRFVYLTTRKNYRFVRMAEYIRTLFNVVDDADNLIPTIEDESLANKSDEMEEMEDEE